MYDALTYSGEKIDKEEGRLLMTNHIYNDGAGTVDIRQAMEDFLALMPVRSKVEKPVAYISLNPHPDGMLTDTGLQDIAQEYLGKMGFGNQPYMVYKREDISHHHLHVVTVRMDGDGRSIDTQSNFYRSKQITHELERKYGLHNTERKSYRTDTPLYKVDVLASGAKKQAGNVVRELSRRYRFQTMGGYHALFSLYNMTVEEARGNMRGRKYNRLVYSVTDDGGNRVGNPFKSSLFEKSVSYDTVRRKFAHSKTEIKGRELADVTKCTVLPVLQGMCDKERFTATLKEKGINTVLCHTEEGRIYGVTLIDHRTGCVLNGSCMSRELSANALQGHFILSYTRQSPVPLFTTTGSQGETQVPSTPEYGRDLDCMGLFSPEGPAMDTKKKAFIRAIQCRKKKKKRKGLEV